jgi:TonB family protein
MQIRMPRPTSRRPRTSPRLVLPLLPTALLAVLPSAGLAQTKSAGPPPGATIFEARAAARFNPRTHCSDVRPAEAGDAPAALVVFEVGATGVPTAATIKSSSQSGALDNAALACVLRLRFQPATRLGDGVPIDSWQQMAWKWARLASTPVAADAPAMPVPQDRFPAPRGNTPGAAEVRACVDEKGKLTQVPTLTRSSGDAHLDRAAIQIANSGAAYFRPEGDQQTESVSGCVQMAVTFERK